MRWALAGSCVPHNSSEAEMKEGQLFSEDEENENIAHGSTLKALFKKDPSCPCSHLAPVTFLVLVQYQTCLSKMANATLV